MTNRGSERDVPSAQHAKSYRRVELTPRDVESRGDEDRDGQSVGQSNGEIIVSGGFDRADPDEDQCERANEFCKAGTELIHPSMESNVRRSGNDVVRQYPTERCRSNRRRNSDISVGYRSE